MERVERRPYHQIGRDLASARSFIFAAVAIFLGAAVVGALFPQLSLPQLEVFREYAEMFRGRSWSGLALLIFFNNAMAAGLAILLAPLLGLVPLLGVVTNGLILGAFWLQHASEFWRLIPHGIFELPAVFIAWGVGLWIGFWVVQARTSVLRERLGVGLRLYFSVVVPLLVVAALVEASAAYLMSAGG